MRSVSFIYDERVLDHAPPAGHPERPERVRAIVRHLRKTGLWESLVHHLPREATEDDLLAVHSPSHVRRIRDVVQAGGGLLDEGDTHTVPASWLAAVLSAGAVTTAVDLVLGNKTSAAFCCIRPPGHHAERDRAMGFCLFNNVAVGARYAQKRFGTGKIAILDWDVHHGNGTQHIFYEDPSVLYVSLHQFPFYPGTGARSERGEGKGEGYTLNIPFPAGTNEETYLRCFSDEVVPALTEYKPDLLMVSAGFDAHRDDPLGGMLLTEDSFAEMTRLVCLGVPVISVLEGGYDLAALGKSVESHLRILETVG
jgi:acetoin utilization deacetylase AcuC-like enzyme